MRTKFDAINGKREWILDRWYQKTNYVIGTIATIWIVAAFAIGFVAGLAEALK